MHSPGAPAHNARISCINDEITSIWPMSNRQDASHHYDLDARVAWSGCHIKMESMMPVN